MNRREFRRFRVVFPDGRSLLAEALVLIGDISEVDAPVTQAWFWFSRNCGSMATNGSMFWLGPGCALSEET